MRLHEFLKHSFRQSEYKYNDVTKLRHSSTMARIKDHPGSLPFGPYQKLWHQNREGLYPRLEVRGHAASPELWLLLKVTMDITLV
jgi:hypothetical protein